MSVASNKHDGKKWIQTAVAIVCILVAMSLLSFFEQMGEWFDLESKVSYFGVIAQALAVLIGLSSFIYLIKNEKTSTYLKEVYSETVKVVFPDRNQTAKHTIGIMIGVGIVGFILGLFDFTASYLLSLIH
jgi:preprotein translocase subunit SecE